MDLVFLKINFVEIWNTEKRMIKLAYNNNLPFIFNNIAFLFKPFFSLFSFEICTETAKLFNFEGFERQKTGDKAAKHLY